MSEALKRIRSLSLPKIYPKDMDLIRLVNCKIFDSCVINEIRCNIMSLIAKGYTSALDIANKLGISRTAIYRHLNILKKNGLLIHRDGRYFVAARIFLVYDADVDNEGFIRIMVHSNKGGFMDEDIGFVLVRGKMCKCDICKAFERCLKAVKDLAKKLDVKIRSENPLNGFIEIAREIIYRDVLNIIKTGYLVVEPVTEHGELIKGEYSEETSLQT